MKGEKYSDTGNDYTGSIVFIIISLKDNGKIAETGINIGINFGNNMTGLLTWVLVFIFKIFSLLKFYCKNSFSNSLIPLGLYVRATAEVCPVTCHSPSMELGVWTMSAPTSSTLSEVWDFAQVCFSTPNPANPHNFQSYLLFYQLDVFWCFDGKLKFQNCYMQLLGGYVCMWKRWIISNQFKLSRT